MWGDSAHETPPTATSRHRRHAHRYGLLHGADRTGVVDHAICPAIVAFTQQPRVALKAPHNDAPAAAPRGPTRRQAQLVSIRRRRKMARPSLRAVVASQP